MLQATTNNKETVDDDKIGTSKIATLLINVDWTLHPLGVLSNWSKEARFWTDTILLSKQPKGLFLGKHLYFIYNDAFIPILGNKHPRLFAMPATTIKEEVINIFPNLLEVLHNTTAASISQNNKLELESNPSVTEVYFTTTFNPIYGTEENLIGIECNWYDTTKQVVETRRQQTLYFLNFEMKRNQSYSSVKITIENLVEMNPSDIPYASLLIGNKEITQHPLCEKIKKALRTKEIFKFTIPQEIKQAHKSLQIESLAEAIVIPLNEFAVNNLQGALIFILKKDFFYDAAHNGFLESIAKLLQTELSNIQNKDDNKKIELANKQLQGISSAQDYAIILLDVNGIITSWNQGAQNIKGYSAEQIKGKHFSIFYDADARAKDFPAYELAQAKATGRFEDEGIRLRKDGSQLYANVIITPIYDDNNHHTGFMNITRDLTKKKDFEQQLVEKNSFLEKSNEIKDNFLSNIIHEFITPLTHIISPPESKLTMPQLDSEQDNIRRKQILLVGESVAIKELVTRHLLPHCTIIFASNVEEALIKLNDSLPDLIISDMETGKMNGIQLVNTLCSNNHTSLIPIILLLPNIIDKKNISELVGGKYDYLTTPINVAELQLRVNTHLKLGCLRRSLMQELKNKTNLLFDINNNLNIEKILYKTLADNMPSGLMRTNEQGVILFVNSRACQLIGKTERQIIEGEWEAAIHPEDKESVVLAWQNAINLGKKFHALNFRYLHETGNIVWVTSQSAVEVGPHNTIIGYIVTITDITPIKDLEAERLEILEQISDYQTKQLMNSESLKREQELFTAALCHELLNPINAISGAIETLNVDSNIESLKQDIKLAVKHIEMVVRDVLDLSSIEAKTFIFRLKSMNIKKIIEQIVLKLNGRLKSKNVEIKFTCQIKDIIYDIDAEKFSKIINNILFKCIKYVPNGVIEIIVNEIEQMHEFAVLQFTIKDNGLGITEQQKIKMFCKFSDFSSNFHDNSGTGLGIVLSQKLIELMGGKFTIKSEIGKGSEYIFTLKLKKNDIKIKNEIFQYKTKSASILLVEDNMINQKVLANILKSAGHSCTIAADGIAALALFTSHTFDLIFMDIEMPRMGGLEATLEWRKQEIKLGRSAIPIIGLSANAKSEQVEEALNSGMNDYLTKPIKKHLLITSIDKAINGEYRQNITHSESSPQTPNSMAILKDIDELQVIATNLKNKIESSKKSTLPLESSARIAAVCDELNYYSNNANSGVTLDIHSENCTYIGRPQKMPSGGSRSQSSPPQISSNSSNTQFINLYNVLNKWGFIKASAPNIPNQTIRISKELKQNCQNFGFELIDVERDGKCFYHALVHQLKISSIHLEITDDNCI